MAEEVGEKWLVVQAEDAEGYGHLFIGVTWFDTLDEAKEYAANVIRNEWAPLTDITVPEGVRNLADMPGYTYSIGSVKWSKIHYSEDRMEAWYADRAVGIFRKLSICKAGEKGVRVC